MNNPQQQLTSFLEKLIDHVARTEVKLEIFKHLEDCKKDSRIEALDTAPAFFMSVRDSLLTDIILMIDKFFDEGADAKRSLIQYLEQTKMHFHSLHLANDYITVDSIQGQLNSIRSANAKEIIKKVAAHRDRYRAHHDKRYFDAPHKLYEDAPLHVTELEELVKKAQAILRTHYMSLCGPDRTMRPVNADDVTQLIKIIQRHNKMIKDPEIFRLARERRLLD